MNLPNKMTLLRIILIPVFMVVLYWGFPGATWVALAIFIIASLTDMLDGKIARKYNLVTDFGKFADPLADKMLVTAAMLWFVEIGQMPVSDGWDTALDAANQAAGGIAQTDIAAGQPLFGAIVSRRPVAEPGQTVIDVRVTGTVDGIAAGDVMDLVSGTPCDASAGTTSSRDESAGGRSCVLARSATAMDAAHDDAMTGGTLITFALTPDEAISIINAQELGPIMAVTAQ